MPLLWRELFTRASLGRSGASKQLAPQRWPHPGRIIFSKTINPHLNSGALRGVELLAQAEKFPGTRSAIYSDCVAPSLMSEDAHAILAEMPEQAAFTAFTNPG